MVARNGNNPQPRFTQSLYILPEAVEEMIASGVNPLDLLASHRMQARERHGVLASLHTLASGKRIGIWTETQRIVMLLDPD
jgi:hypothetical protein